MGSSMAGPVELGDVATEQLDVLRLAVAAYLARFKGTSRKHTESDLRVFLTWCAQRNLPALRAQRAHVELYVRWMQEVRRFQPSTVGRRLSVVCGFYRTPPSSTACSNTRQPNTSAAHPSQQTRRP